MYGYRRISSWLRVTIGSSLSRCAAALRAAPLSWALGFAAVAIVASIAIVSIRDGRLAANATPELICAAMAAGVAIAEGSSTARLHRQARRHLQARRGLRR